MSSRLQLPLAVLSFVLVASVAVVLVKPALDEVRAAQQQLVIAEAKLEREQKRDEAFDRFRVEMTRNRRQLERVEQSLPTETEGTGITAELIAMLDAVSRNAGGVLVESVSVTEEQGEDAKTPRARPQPWTIKKSTVTIRMLASYESLKRFLDAASKSVRLLEPVSVSIETRDPQAIHEVVLHMRVFKQTEGELGSSSSIPSDVVPGSALED